jgi:general secretion pathway protein K
MNPPRRHPSGSALLAAMLAVALVATLSTMALWQLWRQVSLQSLQQHGRQSQWLLLGAMDWGRIALREDARAGQVDHLAEPWALPLAPTSLGRFLQPATGATPQAAVPASEDLWLSGQIMDAQSKFNLYDLSLGQPAAIEAWQRLFAHLNLPASEADAVVAQWQLARQSMPSAPLLPQRVGQLSWLGLSSSSLARLAAHVVMLPSPSTLNVNTATPEALAAMSGLSLTQARRWAMQRQSTPATTLEQARQALGLPATALPAERFGVQSQWFEIQGLLTRTDLDMQARALVRRQDVSVRLTRLQFEPPTSTRPSKVP